MKTNLFLNTQHHKLATVCQFQLSENISSAVLWLLSYLTTQLCLSCSHYRPDKNKERSQPGQISAIRIDNSWENLLFICKFPYPSQPINIFCYMKLNPDQKSCTSELNYTCLLNYFKLSSGKAAITWVSPQQRGSR